MDDYSQHTLFDRLGVAFLLVALLLMVSGAYSYECYGDAAPGVGAVSWYSLDNAQISGATTMDICNEYNMTDGANVPTKGAVGQWNEAYKFAGIEYIIHNADIIGSYPVSISFWANSTQHAQNDFAVYYGDVHSSTQNYGAGCGSANDGARILVPGNGQEGATDITTGAFFHIVAIWKNATYRAIYVNTQLNATNTANVAYANVDQYAIGRLQDATPSSGWIGNIDEVAIFNYTLSATEITNLYTYNNVSGIAGCSVDFTPLSAVINVPTAITGTKGIGCGNWDGNYYWNFTNATGHSHTGNTNPTTQTFTNGGQWIGNFTATIGGVNYTRERNLTIGLRPIANFTTDISSPLYVFDAVQFNDTSYDINTPLANITTWYWDFGDGNTTSGIHTADKNATNTFVLPGEYEVCLIVQNNITINSTEYCDNITINGFSIDVFDEQTLAAIPNWNVTITNSTGCSYNATLQSNTWVWSNFTDVCTGSITINLEASGYIARTYYGVYNIGSYINLDAYLLDSASGVYPVFIVRDGSDYSPIENAILTFRKLISGSYVTVAQATTDASGTTQVYLDPTTIYRLTVTASGYTTYTTNSFQPVSTTYVISLSATTGTTISNSSSRLYMIIKPQGSTEITQNTTIEFECNDPWSNTAYYNMSIFHNNGTLLYIGNGTSASCGIISYDITPLNLGTFQWITVNGTVYRNGQMYYTTTRFYIHGSAPPGTNIAYWLGHIESANLMDASSMGIVALIVTIAAIVAASMAFGWGAGLVGIPVAGAFAYYGWLDPLFFIMIAAATIMIYASRRWDR